MVEIIIVKLADELPFQYDYLKCISYEKRIRILKYIKEADKKRSLISELLIRKAASDKLGIPVNRVNISYNPYGKPYIDNVRYFKFNVSHSESYVVIAISKYKIGIDVEMNKKTDFAIAERFFTKNEYQYIKSFTTESEKINAFYMLWTLKESYVKALGKGLGIPLNSFEFEIDNGIQIWSQNVKMKFMFTSTRIYDYTLSLCHQEKKIKYTYLNESDIYSYYKEMGTNLIDNRYLQ